MSFFTTPERMEIGDLPMTIVDLKPTRAEALKYYRRAVEHFEIEVHQYEKCHQHRRPRQRLHRARHRSPWASAQQYGARKIVIATGFYDHANYLGIPGENLPNVSHYFTEPHPYWNQEVVIIGGGNSAAEAALELFRAGARVTIVASRRGNDQSV